MIRFTCEVNPSLIELGVLSDPTLNERVESGKIPIVTENVVGDDIILFCIGHVTDIYIANGALQVSTAFKASVAFYFDTIDEIKLYPVFIGFGNDWRLVRFDVKKKKVWL